MSDPFAAWGDRSTLHDEVGQPILVFSPSETVRESIPWADAAWVPPAVPARRAASLALKALPGWRFSTSDGGLAEALMAAGARERRHAHTLTHSLVTAPQDAAPTAPGVQVVPLTPAQVDRHALTLGALNLLAYPAGHPDAFDGDEAAAVSQIRAIARGELLGPMMAESRIAIADRAIAGACLVVDRPGGPPHGGPWVIDVFRDPGSAVPGIGTALVTSVLRAASEARLPGLSLTVSDGNHRARSLYRRLGFVEVDESWTLALPEEGERPEVRDQPSIS